METKPELNLDLFERIACAIAAQPRSLDMDSYHNTSDCGTTHCIAGFACALSGNQERAVRSRQYFFIAMDALGLTEEEANSLFLASSRDVRDPSFIMINRERESVPAMLRWMVEHRNFSWADAFQHFKIYNPCAD